jgi:hypothetical protein
VLLDHADRLVSVLGMGWESEGPLFEADELRIDVFRRLRDAPQEKEKIYLSVSLAFPTSREDPPAPPERMPMSVVFEERNEYAEPETRMKRLLYNVVAYAWTAGAMGAAGAAGYLTKRASGSSFLGFLIGAVTLVLAMFGPIAVMGFLGSRASSRQERRKPAASPSRDFVAMIEAAKRVLCDPRHGIVDLRET